MDVNYVMKSGSTALSYAIGYGKRPSKLFFDFLFKSVVNLNHSSSLILLLRLHKIIMYFLHLIFINLFIGLENIVQMLIKKGANVNAGNENHRSPLISAVRKGKVSNMAYLV